MIQESRPGVASSYESDIRRTSTRLLDQREGWLVGLPKQVDAPSVDMPAIIAVGGGKGGVGKSILSANLSARLAALGYRVLILDLDLGCSNLHTHFGIHMPKKTLADFIVNRSLTFRDVLHKTGLPNVALLPGGREEAWGQFLRSYDIDAFLPLWDRMLHSKADLGVDIVVLDLGAGTQQMTMDFFAAANLGIVTVLPEPTSIENAYVFMKAMLWNLMDHVADRTDQPLALEDAKAALAATGGSFKNGYAQCLRNLSPQAPEFIGTLFSALQSRHTGILVNQCRSQQDIDIGASMQHITKQYFGFQAELLGHMNYDDSAWKSLRNRRLVITDFPHSLLAKKIHRVTATALKTLGLQ